MPNAFGYQNWQQQRPTPRPQDVGRLLMERQLGGMPAGPEAATEPATPPTQPDAMADPLAMEPDPHQMAQGSDWPSSAELALRSAIIRGPGKPGQNQGPGAPGNRLQLERLGMRPEEIDLLNATGGANAE